MKLKKVFLYISLILLSCFSLFAKSQYIAVEEIDAKIKPSFWGSKIDTFYYGEKVEIIDEKGSWVKIVSDTTKKTGWVKDSVLTSKKIIAKNNVSVDADEIALAGKGFSSPLEAEYSKEYGIDFDNVDLIENVNVTDEDVQAFIEEGQLRGAE